MYLEPPKLDFEPIPPQLIRAYIAQSRVLEPHIPPSLSNYIVEQYVQMRLADKADADQAGCISTMTARQLLSILRMAQAMARIRFDNQVSLSDVDEAIRLISVSKRPLEVNNGLVPNNRANRIDITSSIWEIILNWAKSNNLESFEYESIEPIIMAKGFTTEKSTKHP